MIFLGNRLSYLANQPEPDAEQLRGKLNELEARESRLARLSRAFNRHLQVRAARLDEVRSYLPRGGALLELRQYRPADFKTGDFGDPRWAALLLPADGEPSLHDLGPVAATRALWGKLRASGERTAAAALYRQLFGTLDERLSQYEPLYLAPDGFLNLVAFARLVTPEDRYWIERQTLRLVQSGRHLIAREGDGSAKPEGLGLLALGGIDYDSDTTPTAPTPVPVSTNPSVMYARRALNDEIGRFTRLGESLFEAREVSNAYWDPRDGPTRLWHDGEASEHKLKQLTAAPWVLHLATHGFYLHGDEDRAERPMVLSGLALAGANRGLKGQRDRHGEDGILYALEVLDLNLQGTELVTLSACDTGAGTLDYSEGVYGLVRGFRIAGARHVLMSLWSLGDASAREFMARFYRTWLDGSMPGDLATALRATQRSFIDDEDARWRDPTIWAPYVLVETH